MIPRREVADSGIYGLNGHLKLRAVVYTDWGECEAESIFAQSRFSGRKYDADSDAVIFMILFVCVGIHTGVGKGSSGTGLADVTVD
eukprot:gene9897-20587_t